MRGGTQRRILHHIQYRVDRCDCQTGYCDVKQDKSGEDNEGGERSEGEALQARSRRLVEAKLKVKVSKGVSKSSDVTS